MESDVMPPAVPRVDVPALQAWVGRTETREDRVTAASLSAWSATLDRADPVPATGADAPPLSHWTCFNPATRQRDIGPDGHAKRGGFLPPVDLPRRMWAGGRLDFHHPLRVGSLVTRTSHVVKIDGKDGRRGPLVFVTVRHAIGDARGTAIVEEHDIVYRDQPSGGATVEAASSAPGDETFGRRIVPDPVLLFRYSALTFNGHRIHYDRPYATGVEHYAGLVVHGPLIATLLLDLLRREQADATVRRFTFRAVAPLFDTSPFDVCGRPDGERRFALWARDANGRLAMSATADIA